jgi:uncharacterized membrane protein YebE (DUF533 family)
MGERMSSNKYIEQLVKMAEEKNGGGLGTAAAALGGVAVGALGARKLLGNRAARKGMKNAGDKVKNFFKSPVDKPGVPKQGDLFKGASENEKKKKGMSTAAKIATGAALLGAGGLAYKIGKNSIAIDRAFGSGKVPKGAMELLEHPTTPQIR